MREGGGEREGMVDDTKAVVTTLWPFAAVKRNDNGSLKPVPVDVLASRRGEGTQRRMKRGRGRTCL